MGLRLRHKSILHSARKGQYTLLPHKWKSVTSNLVVVNKQFILSQMKIKRVKKSQTLSLLKAFFFLVYFYFSFWCRRAILGDILGLLLTVFRGGSWQCLGEIIVSKTDLTKLIPCKANALNPDLHFSTQWNDLFLKRKGTPVWFKFHFFGLFPV